MDGDSARPWWVSRITHIHAAAATSNRTSIIQIGTSAPSRAIYGVMSHLRRHAHFS